MRSKLLWACLLMMTAAVWPSSAPQGHDSGDGIARQLLAAEALANAPGYRLTAVTVELPPGEIAAPHKHEAFAFVYVIEGRVRSQLDDQPALDYRTGDTWIEPPGAVHSLTQNLSSSETAKLLAIFVSKEGAKLRTPVEDVE